ncbi:MAG: hypothetical protein AAB551_01365 [Patescibacteria group bacterium]
MNDQEEFQELMDEFVSNVIVKLELGELPPEREAVLREVIFEKIDRRMLEIMIDELSDDQFDELLEKLDERPLTEAEQQMLFSEAASQIADFSGKFAHMLQEVEADLVADARELKGLIAATGNPPSPAL